MDRIEVNVLTGEQDVIPFTPEEIAARPTPPPPVLPYLTFAQLLIALVSLGWITEAEGEAWLAGVLPAAVVALIDTLPQAERFAAKARAIRPSIIDPNDRLVNALCASRNMTEQEKLQFFLYAANL
jgi:hypothetical protein